LAVCLEEEKNWADALDEYRVSLKRIPRVSDCGNALSGIFVENQMSQGRCLEALGRHREAVEAYLLANSEFFCLFEPGAARRIVDLYEAAGRIDAFKKLLEQRNRQYLASLPADLKEQPEWTVERHPDRRLYRILEVKEATRLERWDKLVEVLKGSGPPGGLDRPEAWLAAEVLATRADKAVPLLKPALSSEPGRSTWVIHALGLCGTPDAVKILRERGESLGRTPFEDRQQGELVSICRALNRSKAGKYVLTVFDFSGTDSLKAAVKASEQASTEMDPRPKFPPIPKDLRLD
jgi:hypothetical protein